MDSFADNTKNKTADRSANIMQHHCFGSRNFFGDAEGFPCISRSINGELADDKPHGDADEDAKHVFAETTDIGKQADEITAPRLFLFYLLKHAGLIDADAKNQQ